MSDPSIFVHLLGPPTVLGIQSWLELIVIFAAAVGAIVAIVQMRRTALHSRAALLLQLDKQWDDMAESRKAFKMLFEELLREVNNEHQQLSDSAKQEQLRKKFVDKLDELRQDKNSNFAEIIAVVSFFESVGMWVKKGYIPLDDARALYKGPIIELDIAFSDYIPKWQQESQKPAGLFMNFLYISKKIKVERRFSWKRKTHN